MGTGTCPDWRTSLLYLHPIATWPQWPWPLSCQSYRNFGDMEKGGMHIYGAFILGGIALVLYARIYKLPLLLYLDAAGLALLPGQAIGRWANFIHQELYGPPTTLPWGLRIDVAHRIPPYN